MKLLRVVPLLLLSVFSTVSSAAVINTSIGAYDVSTISGSYTTNQTLLADQAWWGSEELALEFANLLGDQLGLPEGAGSRGPVFAYSDPGGYFIGAYYNTAAGNTATLFSGSLTGGFTFAVASPVPIPAAAWLFGSALLGLGALKRRKAT